MGRKTWFSISRERRPLKNRLNLILTNDPNLLSISPYPRSSFSRLDKQVYFLTFYQFLHFYKMTNSNVFVIGGSEIYDLFLTPPSNLQADRVYLTEVYDYKVGVNSEPDCFMTPLDESYKLISVSEKEYDKGYELHYRFLQYKRYNDFISSEHEYLKLAQYILENGNSRPDRTRVGTISSFGHKMDFDISEFIPLLTTKRVPWKHCIEELLWFMRGDTDARILQSRGVKIWDGNTSREFLDSRGLHHYETGILGKGYGWQWRFFGAKYSQAFADTSRIDNNKVGGFDQLAYVENLLKTDPFSRRILMCYWNPPDFDKTALLPCHYSCQFYVTEKNGERYLSCLFNMRSNDFLLGNPFNIFSYAVLTYILAIRCDMKPDRLVYMGGDVHIYKNHIDQVKQQLARSPRSLPKLIVNPSVKCKSINEITITDFEVIGYFPHAPIRAPMAI
jgi:thymidylate synthase